MSTRILKDGLPLRWKQPLGGGGSGPSVCDGLVFVMDRLTDNEDMAGGKLLHKGKPPSNINFVRRLLPGREGLVCLALHVKYAGRCGGHAVSRRAGFRKGEVIVAGSGLAGRSAETDYLDVLLRAHMRGETVSIGVLRGGRRMTLRQQ